jgi:hypothetical protein
VILWLLVTLGCAEVDEDPCAYVRDLIRTEDGLALTPDEHGVGWGNETCLQCHQTWNTHVRDCSRAVDWDLEAIREAADFEDPTTCVPCHGANGVPALEEAETVP